MNISFDERQLFHERTDEILERISPRLEDSLRFEKEMFHSRLELLALRSQDPELEVRTDARAVRRNLHEFLKDDLVYFLQKALIKSDLVPERGAEPHRLPRVYAGMLKEFNAPTLYPAGKNFERLSIPEKWYGHLSDRSSLTERKGGRTIFRESTDVRPPFRSLFSHRTQNHQLPESVSP